MPFCFNTSRYTGTFEWLVKNIMYIMQPDEHFLSRNSSERKGEQYLSFGPNNSGSIHDSRNISLEHFCLDTQGLTGHDNPSDAPESIPKTKAETLC